MWLKRSPSEVFEEYGVIDKIESPLERYMVDLVAIGKVNEDMPDPAPKDLSGDLTSKWKLDELEYQARRARLIAG